MTRIMLSLADTTRDGAVVATAAGTGVAVDVLTDVVLDEGRGVDVALLPQATNIMVRRIIMPVIDGLRRRMVSVSIFIASAPQ